MAASNSTELSKYRDRYGDILGEPMRMLPPILGYEKAAPVSLEEAVKRLDGFVRCINQYVRRAKDRSSNPANGLSVDESAAIRLYTMEWTTDDGDSLYKALNNDLRQENRDDLKKWFPYLRLLMTGLCKLPPVSCDAFRGVKLDLSKNYEVDSTIIWWAFSSCSKIQSTLQSENFFGKSGPRTLFKIDCVSARDIKQHSEYPHEEEVLLVPARQFTVKSKTHQPDGVIVIVLDEFSPQRELIKFPDGLSIYSTLSPSSNLDINMDDILRNVQKGKPVQIQGQRIDEDAVKKIIKALINNCSPTLIITGAHLSENTMKSLAKSLRECTRLKNLDLSNNQLSTKELHSLFVNLSSNEQIEVQEEGCFGVIKIKRMEICPVSQLNLSKNRIDDAGAADIAKFIKSKTTVVSVNVSENRIGDAGLEALCDVLNNPAVRLKELNLNGNRRVTDESILALKRMFNNNQFLKVLSLNQCSFTENGKTTLIEASKSKKGFKILLQND